MASDGYLLKPQVRLRAWKGTPFQYAFYAALCDHAYNEGGLPDSPKEVARMTGLPVEQVRDVWSLFTSTCTELEDGTLMPRDIIESVAQMKALSSKRADSGRAGGKARKAEESTIAPAENHNGHHHHQVKPADDGEFPTELPDIYPTILELFPSQPQTRKVQELVLMCIDLKAQASDVRRWPRWFQFRYPAKAKTVWTFGETFPDMMREPKELPTAVRFIISASYQLDAKEHERLTAVQFQTAMNQGEILGQMVGLDKATDWRARNYMPSVFVDFWRSATKSPNKYPAPESIIKYWRDFVNSSHAAAA